MRLLPQALNQAGQLELPIGRICEFSNCLLTQGSKKSCKSTFGLQHLGLISDLPISAARVAALEEFAAPAIAAGQLDLPPASKRKPSKTRIAILEAYAARALALGEIVHPDPPQPKQPTRQRNTPAATATSTLEPN